MTNLSQAREIDRFLTVQLKAAEEEELRARRIAREAKSNGSAEDPR